MNILGTPYILPFSSPAMVTPKQLPQGPQLSGEPTCADVAVVSLHACGIRLVVLRKSLRHFSFRWQCPARNMRYDGGLWVCRVKRYGHLRCYRGRDLAEVQS
jgi:hypothetical protein